MALAALRRQFHRLHVTEIGIQQGRGPLKLALIVVAPLAAVEQGGAIALQQGNQVLSHHWCGSHRSGHRQVKAPAADRIATTLLGPLAAQLNALAQPQLLGHGLHRLQFAANGVHQGELGLGQCNRHG